jgi:hypothetical protein
MRTAALLSVCFWAAACNAPPAPEPVAAPPPATPNPYAQLAAPPATAPWTYTDSLDEMRGQRRVTGCTAGLSSSGEMETDPLLSLCIRQDEEQGSMGDFIVITLVASEAFDCILDCEVPIKLGDGEVRNWEVAHPNISGLYNVVVFVRSPDMARALAANTSVMAELRFVGGRTKQFRFDTSNLSWPPPTHMRNLAAAD